MNTFKVQRVFRFSNYFFAPLLALLSLLIIQPTAFAQHPWPWSENIPNFWEMQEQDVQEHVKESIKKFNQEIEEIVQTPKDKRSFENTILRFDRVRFRLVNETSFLQVMALNDQRQDFRQLAFQLDRNVFEVLTKVYYRNDLFAVLKDGTPLAEPQAQLKNRIIREFEESGAHLDSSVQQRDTQIRSNIHELSQEFHQNLQLKKNRIYLSQSDLQGAPDSVLDRMEQNQQGSWVLTSDMIEAGRDLLKYVVSPSVRQQIYELLGTAGGEDNLQLASQILKLRKERTHIHRELSWVHSQVRHQMLQTPERVETFLSRVKSAILPTYLQERKDLQALYDRFYLSEHGSSDSYQPWDVLFLTQKYLQNTLELDEEHLRPYFEASRVVKETLKIFSELYGVEFHHEKSIKTWSPDVAAYSVHLKNKGAIAVLYLDLFRRPGKALGSFSKMTNYHWIAKDRSTARQPRVDSGRAVVLVHTNMTQAQNGQPHLLSFEDVQESLFHELGHTMHLILARAPYPGLSADRVPSDFVEVPAQLMEKVAGSREVIERLGSHYKTAAPIPQEEVRKLIHKNSVFVAQRWMGRLVQDMFDYKIHSSDSTENILDVYRSTAKEMTGFEPAAADWTPARLGHLYAGYDGKMYSFLWASVIVENLTQKLMTAQGTWDRNQFQDYAKTLLARAGIEDTSLAVQNFLGKGVSFQPLKDVFQKEQKTSSMSALAQNSFRCDQVFKP